MGHLDSELTLRHRVPGTRPTTSWRWWKASHGGAEVSWVADHETYQQDVRSLFNQTSADLNEQKLQVPHVWWARSNGDEMNIGMLRTKSEYKNVKLDRIRLVCFVSSESRFDSHSSLPDFSFRFYQMWSTTHLPCPMVPLNCWSIFRPKNPSQKSWVAQLKKLFCRLSTTSFRVNVGWVSWRKELVVIVAPQWMHPGAFSVVGKCQRGGSFHFIITWEKWEKVGFNTKQKWIFNMSPAVNKKKTEKPAKMFKVIAKGNAPM